MNTLVVDVVPVMLVRTRFGEWFDPWGDRHRCGVPVEVVDVVPVEDGHVWRSTVRYDGRRWRRAPRGGSWYLDAGGVWVPFDSRVRMIDGEGRPLLSADAVRASVSTPARVA